MAAIKKGSRYYELYFYFKGKTSAGNLFNKMMQIEGNRITQIISGEIISAELFLRSTS